MNDKVNIKKALFAKGNLSFLLQSHQLPIYNELWKIIKSPDLTNRSYVINSARQFGKSFCLLVVAIEYAIRHPTSSIRFAIPVASNYYDMYMKSLNIILEFASAEVGIEHFKSEKRIIFKNGSYIKFAGTDGGNAVNLRGSAANLVILDECAFMDDLDNIWKSILFPQLLTTKGKGIFCTTPPESADHDFVEIYKQHLEDGLVSQFTIYDNNSLSQEEIESIIKTQGGIDSSKFKREFLCQFVQETEMTIIPEWKEDYKEDHPRHKDYFTFYNKFEALDSGVADLTICLFGYYDFLNAKVIVEDEIKMNGPEMTTLNLSNDIKDKEQQLEYTKVLLRIADNNNLHLIQDLAITYRLPFAGTSKTDLDAMINKVKIWVGQGKIIVHPRCEQLLGSLQHGKWAKNKRGELFAKSKKFGHYDALAALVYLIRNVESIMNNPIPVTHGLHSNSMIPDGFNRTINRASADSKKLAEALSSNRRR